MPQYQSENISAKNISFSRKKHDLLLSVVVVFLAAIFVIISATISVRAAVNIRDVRVGLHPNKTRVVVELDKIALYRISYLQGADFREIIIDLQKTLTGDDIKMLVNRVGGIGVLDRITIKNHNGSVRLGIFLDTSAVVDNSFALKPDHGRSYRLVFDLKAISAKEWSQQVKSLPSEAKKPKPATKIQVVDEVFPEASPAISSEPSPEPQDEENYDDMVSNDSNLTLSGYAEVEVRGFSKSAMYPGQERWTASFALEPLVEYVSDSGNSQFTFRSFGRVDLQDRNRSHFDIRELKWTGTRDRWQVTIGIDTIFWGVTESNHLVDIINQDDSLEDIDREDKLGQPLASVSYDSNFGVFSLYVMPYFREQRFAGKKGRLRLPLPIDISQTQYQAGAGKWHTDLAVRWSDVIGNIDVGLYHFRGTNRQPQLSIGKDSQGNLVLIPRYRLISQTGLDLQGTFNDLLVKFEGIRRTGLGQNAGPQNSALQIPGLQNFPALNLATQNYWAMTGGFEYTFYRLAGGDSDIGLLTEYLYDSRGQQATTPFENDLFIGVRWARNDIDNTTVLLGAVFDLQTSAKFVNFESSRRIGDNWKLSLDARFFLNIPVTSFLYPLSRDDFFQIRLARYF